MSTLQLALIIAGIVLVAGVWIFNGWQERRVRRRMAEASRPAGGAGDADRVEPTLATSDARAHEPPHGMAWRWAWPTAPEAAPWRAAAARETRPGSNGSPRRAATSPPAGSASTTTTSWSADHAVAIASAAVVTPGECLIDVSATRVTAAPA